MPPRREPFIAREAPAELYRYTAPVPRRRKKRNRLAGLLRHAALVVLAFVAVSVALVLPLRWFAPATTAFMLQDASGRKPVAYAWRAWNDLGTNLPLAVMASEDQKFIYHHGFDLDSIRESVENYGDGARLRGASTITQQLAKNLYLWPGRNLARKGLEAWFALLLEACLPKRRILEIYLNVVEFGPGIYGAAAASREFFGTTPAALGVAPAATLAAVLPNPKRMNAGAPTPYVLERQRWIAGQMARLRREGWLAALQ